MDDKECVFDWEANGLNDGFQYKNLLANFSHLRHTKKTPWIKHFIKFIEVNKK